MSELSRGPQSEELVVREFVRDVEVFVAGTMVPRPGDARSEAIAELVERAHALCREGEGWLQWGSSGMPMTGEQIAAHAEAAVEVLRLAGWNPSARAGRSIRDALIHAEKSDRRFVEDTRMVIGDILGLLIRALTGAPRAYYETWDTHPSRTVGEVFDLLAAAAAFARAHGPAGHVTDIAV